MSSTDSRLLDVAIEHFGRRGLEGASTRAIAADADTPMSSITYHFSGKNGLYLAAAEHISASLGERLRPAIEQVAVICADGIDVAAARASLHAIFGRMVEVMVSEDTAAFARFIVREQAEPTEAFDRIYAGAMGQILARVAAMLRVIAGNALDEIEARIRAMTLVGQILVFRVARATVLAETGWNNMAAPETAIIKATVLDNLDAIFDRLERRSSL
ncbi:CerR family C-terminal domain-containing protein [Sphingopyxis macrogoltabida]|uniref:CerR family C-terminal domain-containing protein n=1 Tax=Sphingopyxis macrogoltabida TaxID=33050 RepID=UPI0009EA8CC5|nr:CerR family C-terminal domain-containing protein [Sphingopyxis macrogoltabida]